MASWPDRTAWCWINSKPGWWSCGCMNRRRRVETSRGANQLRHPMQSQHVTLRAAARDNPGRDMRNERVMPEFLALMNVGDMHFQDWHIARFQRIQHGDRGVTERRRIDYDPTGDLSRFVDPVDDFVFAIALMATEFQAKANGCLAA